MPRSIELGMSSQLQVFSILYFNSQLLLAEPEAQRRQGEKDQQRDPIPPLHLEVVQRIDLAAVAARHHREIDVAAELDALAQQHADARAGQPPPVRAV